MHAVGWRALAAQTSPNLCQSNPTTQSIRRFCRALSLLASGGLPATRSQSGVPISAGNLARAEPTPPAERWALPGRRCLACTARAPASQRGGWTPSWGGLPAWPPASAIPLMLGRCLVGRTCCPMRCWPWLVASQDIDPSRKKYGADPGHEGADELVKMDERVAHRTA